MMRTMMTISRQIEQCSSPFMLASDTRPPLKTLETLSPSYIVRKFCRRKKRHGLRKAYVK